MSKDKGNYPKTNPVIIRWVDSMITTGWKDYVESDLGCVTIGHLIKKNKDRVVICMNRSHFGGGEYMEIPMCSVISIKQLKEK